ncbi:MAG: hypothetical protein M3Y43_01085, partial [Pseudomonadota bacterium]|nr:hypothetical protein [Pseudomonadota bacterium]
MAVTTNKALLFLAGGVAAAAAVAYGTGALDPLLKRTETIAALPGTDQVTQDAPSPGVASPQPALEVPAQPASPEAPEAAAPAAPDAAAPEAPDSAGDQPVVVAPSFDVVRVEGDGSIVVAGKAAPNAVVDLVVGSNVIGSATAGVDGAFAVVLDDPLKPGDYQIVLRATAPDNVVAMSVETAVVSVPETPEGQVLALVEELGEPSQMIIRPAPQPPAAVAKPPEAEAPPAAAPPLAETPPEAETPAAEPKPEGEMQAALPEQPGQPEPAPAPAPPPQAGPAVRVEAVEIDGRKIFVAGTAEPGRTVRGYANEILLGDAKASPDGTYLIEAERDLPVGDYIIRVDALEADGVKVAARAAVPFEREPGETLAAVAPPPAAPPAATAPASAAPAPEAPNAPATDTKPAVAEAPAPAPSAPPASAPSATAPAPAGQKPEGAEGSVTAQAQPAVPSAEAPAAVADAPDTQAPATEMPAAAPASDPGTPPAA